MRDCAEAAPVIMSSASRMRLLLPCAVIANFVIGFVMAQFGGVSV